jgi:hypothetical protein
MCCGCIAHQARIRQLRHVCGMAPAAPDAPDISMANMRFLELERERLMMERVSEPWGPGQGGSNRGCSEIRCLSAWD